MSAAGTEQLPKFLAAVAAKHGQDMVALVYGAGLASEAIRVLIAQTRNAATVKAVTVVSEAYNQISSSYAKQRGWTEEMLGECDRDINLAFASCVQVEVKTIITGE